MKEMVNEEMVSAIIVRKEKDLMELNRRPRELMMLEALIRIEAESYVGPIHKIDPRTIKPVVSKVFGLYLQLGGISRAMLTNAALEAIKVCGDESNYLEEFGSYEADIKPVQEIIDEIIEGLRKKAGLELKFEDFQKELIQKLETLLPTCKIDPIEIVKPNDIVLHGLAVHEGNVGPTVYIDGAYEEAKEQARHRKSIIAQMAKEMADMCHDCIANMPEDIAAIAETTNKMEWSVIKDQLSFKVLDVRRNKKFLADKVYRCVGCELAIIPEILMNMGSATLPTASLEELGVTADEVVDQAIKNMPKIAHPTLTNIEAQLRGNAENILDGTEAPQSGLFVLSTEDFYHGAAALFAEGMKDRLHDMFGDYYIIPSSIHEILIIRCNGANKDDLRNTILTANQNVVDPTEVLSDELYVYDGETMMICA